MSLENLAAVITMLPAAGSIVTLSGKSGEFVVKDTGPHQPSSETAGYCVLVAIVDEADFLVEGDLETIILEPDEDRALSNEMYFRPSDIKIVGSAKEVTRWLRVEA